MFDILEAQKLFEGEADITLVPTGNELLKQLAATDQRSPKPIAPPALSASQTKSGTG
jgi:hypothetical protein